MKEKTVEKILDVEQEAELSIEVIKNFAYEEEALRSFAKKKLEPYSDILFILVHRRYEEKTANDFWKRLVSHMESMQNRGRLRAVCRNVTAFLDTHASQDIQSSLLEGWCSTPHG